MTNVDRILPTIGSSGYFNLLAPFDSLIAPEEKYTCKAIRTLSDYLANNEDPKTDIYINYGMTVDDYNTDLTKDMHIVSLQSALGHWLYVPARCISSYPLTNGVRYRTVMIGVSLPSLPVDKDLSDITTTITNVIQDSLGVSCHTKLVETSRVILVPHETHVITQAARDLVINSNLTDRGRLTKLQQQLNEANEKLAILESYIIAHQ